MTLDLQPFNPDYHRPGSKAAKGECTWHGSENCRESARWSFRYHKNDAVQERQAACDRALEEAIIGGSSWGR